MAAIEFWRRVVCGSPEARSGRHQEPRSSWDKLLSASLNDRFMQSQIGSSNAKRKPYDLIDTHPRRLSKGSINRLKRTAC
jgi:hypothetical protein